MRPKRIHNYCSCGNPIYNCHNIRCEECLAKSRTCCASCGKTITVKEIATPGKRFFCFDCNNGGWTKKREKTIEESITSLFTEKNIPGKYHEDVENAMRQLASMNYFSGRKIADVVKIVTYLVIKKDTGLACSLLLKDTWKLLRKIGDIKKITNIIGKRSLVLSKKAWTDLQVTDAEKTEIEQILGEPALEKTLSRGVNINGVIAALVYVYLNSKREGITSQLLIGKTLHVTEVTIRSRLRDLINIKEIVDIMDKHGIKTEFPGMGSPGKPRNTKHLRHHIVTGKCDGCGDITEIKKELTGNTGGFSYLCEKCRTK